MSSFGKGGIDESLVPFSEMLAAIVPESERFASEEAALVMETLQIEMPIELDVVQRENGELAIGSSPPLYYLETGFSPVLHQVTITLQRDVELVEDDE